MHFPSVVVATRLFSHTGDILRVIVLGGRGFRTSTDAATSIHIACNSECWLHLAGANSLSKDKVTGYTALEKVVNRTAPKEQKR